MKATLDRVDLQRSVTQLKSMTGKGVLGVTGNERGVELTTYSTDADMSVVATVPGDVEPSDAVALATLDLAMKVVKGMPKGEITVEQIGTDTKPSVQFAVGDAESVILSPDPNNYETPFVKHEVPEREGDPMPGSEIVDALAHVLRAVSTDKGRETLCQVLFTANETRVCECPEGRHMVGPNGCSRGQRIGGSHMRIVATDSYRLHIVDLPDVAPLHSQGLLVDGKSLKRTFKRFAKQTVRLQYEKGSGRQKDSVWVTTPRLSVRFDAREDGRAARFPRYETLIPQDDDCQYQVTVERQSLVAVLNRFIGISKDYPARLTIEQNVMLLRQQATGMVNTGKVACETSSDSDSTLETAFNPLYLRDALLMSDDPTVNIMSNDGMKPTVVSDSNDRMAVLMPVRVK